MIMEGDLIKINKWLCPIAWLYGLGVKVRNELFELGILKSRSFDIPVISVGNITVGGTGKTPHTEYLIRLLQDKYQVAVLSRGYKRKSKGYVLADEHSTMTQIGDEPYQMKQKFPTVHVAVDKDRCHGIDRLCLDETTRNTEVVILDDAFQHRYVKPDVNILLTDYHRLISEDLLLPAGRLREPKEGKSRANIVIVTKCPRDIKPITFRVISKSLNLFPYQKLYFSTFKYNNLSPLYNKGTEETRPISSIKKEEHIMLLTGIASPEQMLLDLEERCQNITPLSFPDHHYFTAKDIKLINDTYQNMSTPKLIITTEKDATRLKCVDGLSTEVKQALYVLPIEIDILQNKQESFNKSITGYVFKNSRNSTLAKK